MPKFFKKDLLSSPLDKPELPSGDHFTPADLDDDPTKTLLTWRAPARPYRKKDRSYYTTIVILLTLISMIAFLAGEKLLIGVMLALGFIIYVLNFVPPEEIEYKLSAQGVTTGHHFYHWQELDSFWFSEKDGHKLLNILTELRFPSMLMLVLGDTSQDQAKKICARFLPFHEIAPKSILDKWAESLQKHFPLENPNR